MENSHAYISLINQINGTGRLKLDGYNLKTLDVKLTKENLDTIEKLFPVE